MGNYISELEAEVSTKVLRAYQELVQYMKNPNISASEILQFRTATESEFSTKPLLYSPELAEQLRAYKQRIEKNRETDPELRVKVGDITKVIRENFGNLYTESKFVPMPPRKSKRKVTPGSPATGPKPGYKGHQIPKELQ